MALALYRKYRPRTFAEVIGQEHVTEPLSQALRSGRLNHAYLFSGPRGCGKTSSARILARSLNCEQGPTPDPCGVCMSCTSLANDGAGSIDVIEIDAASHGGVDDARELREKAFFAPANSRYKIYVIDEAHMVSSAGFNALLKLVEEPPDYVKFIFATTEPDKVLGTIRSRTHHYPFRLIPPAVLRPYLQQLTDAEGVTVEPAVFPLVVRAGGGSARDSLSILDQLIAGSGPDGVTYTGAVALLGVTDTALIDEMCNAIASGDGAAAYATIDRVADAGHEPRRFASDLLERFRDLIVLQQVPDAVAKGLLDGPADQLEAMAGQAAALGAATLSRCADILHNGLIEMRGTTAPRLLLELITARMLLPGADASTAALLQRLERLEQGIVVRGEGPVSTPPPSDTPGVPAHSAPAVTEVASGGVPGGAAGGGKAAAMAAARAALSRPSAGPARPVSPAPGPVGSVPTQPSSTPETTATPVASGPESAVSTDSGSAGSPHGAGVSSGPSDDGPDAAGLSRGDGRSSGPSRGEPVPAGEPDWNQVAGGPSASAGPPAPPEAGYYDDEPPPWDEEPPEPDEPVRRAPARADAAGSRSGAAQPADDRASAGQARSAGADRVEAPSSPSPDGDPRLERVRAAWQALGQHQTKVRAMQDYGIGVREVAGDTIVFAAPNQNLMDRFLTWTGAIAGEFHKSLGGDWRIRCEIGSVDSGPARPRSGTRPGAQADRRDQSAAHQASSGATTRTAPVAAAAPERNSGRTESRPSRPQRAPAADSDDDWPAPARPASSAVAPAVDDVRGHARPGPVEPGGARGGSGGHRPSYDSPDDRGSAGQIDASGNDTGWPEPARPGASPATPVVSVDDEWPEPVKPGSGGGQANADAATDSAWPDPVRPGSGISGARTDGNGLSGMGGMSGTSGPSGMQSSVGAHGPVGADGPAGADGSVRAHGDLGGQRSGPNPGSAAGLGTGGDGSAGSVGVAGSGNTAPAAGGGGGPVAGANSGPFGGSGAQSPGGIAVGGSTSGNPGGIAGGAGSSGNPGGVGGGPGAVSGPGAVGGHGAASGPGAVGRHGGAGLAAGGGSPVGVAGGVGGGGAAGVGGGSAFGGAAVSAAPRGGGVGGKPVPARSAAMEAARAAARLGAGAGARTAEKEAANSSAAAGREVARGVPGKPSGAAAQARAAAAAGGTWSDGSPIEEAPYDPEYDGPPSGGAAFDGFDPGDEPLDEVIDEKTARASSEEQAMQLLREAFGAEKIAEL